MKEVLAVSDMPIDEPPVNKTYIQGTAVTQGTESDVRNFHSRLFLEHNKELVTRCSHLAAQLKADLDGITRHVTELSSINDNTRRYQEFLIESMPWTKFSRIQVIVLVCFSILLLAVGINTIAQVLMASGIPGFESAWRCYLFSLIPIGLAFAFKCLRSLIASPRGQLFYTLGIWLGGLGFGLFWTVLFAQTFPAMTQSTADLINNLSSSGTTAHSSGSSGYALIVVSILAESLLAAGSWLTIQDIVTQHQPSLRVDNPAFEKTQHDLDHWLRRRYEQEDIRGKLGGKIDAVEEARVRFMDQAVGYFRIAQTTAGNNKELNNLFNS